MRKYRFMIVLAALLLSFAYSAYLSRNDATLTEGTISVKLMNSDGEQIGNATLSEQTDGLHIALEAAELSPGKHGFHVHEKQFTGSDFNTAGAHFNPGGKKHGLENPNGPHPGDMPNINVDANGHVKEDIVLKGVSLQNGQANSILGCSLIIHADEDDNVTDPSGNSGDRIAGGNIAK